MPVLRSTALIDADRRAVAGLLRDAELTAAALASDGHRLRVDDRALPSGSVPGGNVGGAVGGVPRRPGVRPRALVLGASRRAAVPPRAGPRPLAPGDELEFEVRLLPGVRVPVRLVVERISPAGLACSGSVGPGPRVAHAVTLTRTGAGTLVLDELRWTTPGGPLGRLLDVAVLRRLVLRAQAARLRRLAERAAELGRSPVVVGTALHRDGRLLVAQRRRPPALAGRWELPGGRVEPGESEPAAVRRECREELGVPVVVTGRLDTDLPIAAGTLRVYVAELAAGAPEPQPLDHAELRWVGPAELADLDWLDADRAVLPQLAALLAGPAEFGGPAEPAEFGGPAEPAEFAEPAEA